MGARHTEAQALAAEAERQGFVVKRSKKGLMIYAKDGERMVMLHLTNSDCRASKNMVAALRRIGVNV